jgi:hypothetical protein
VGPRSTSKYISTAEPRQRIGDGRNTDTAQDKDKRWSLFRVTQPEDKGALLGTYQGRDATKALEKIAYGQKPQW